MVNDVLSVHELNSAACRPSVPDQSLAPQDVFRVAE